MRTSPSLAVPSAEEKTVSAIILDSPSIRLALCYGLAHCRVKIGADRQVLARKYAAEYVVGHEPVRAAAFICGCVP
jgi:hypothetical protein